LFSLDGEFSGVTLTQGSFTYTDSCVVTDGNIRDDPITRPIQLGVPFTISVSDSATESLPARAIDYGDYNNYVRTAIGGGVTFTLQNQ
jgi:hypothetical protein